MSIHSCCTQKKNEYLNLCIYSLCRCKIVCSFLTHLLRSLFWVPLVSKVTNSNHGFEITIHNVTYRPSSQSQYLTSSLSAVLEPDQIWSRQGSSAS